MQNCFCLQTNFHKGDKKAFAQPCTFTCSAHSIGSPGSSQNHCPPALLPACRTGQERTILFTSGFFLLWRSQEIQVVKSLISSEGSGESWPLTVWGHQRVLSCKTISSGCSALHLQQLVHGLKGGHLRLRKKPSCKAGTIQTCAQDPCNCLEERTSL